MMTMQGMGSKEEKFSQELKLSALVAETVGRSLEGMQGGASVVSRKSGPESFDYTTHQDLSAERMAIEHIKEAFPQDAVLSEETLREITDIPERLWIIDPIDGTTNYANGMNTYAVSISFYKQGRVQAAAVSLPALHELYTAERGRGVFLNEKPLPMLNPDQDLKHSFVNLGFPHERTEPVVKNAFALYAEILLACADVRRTGSAVLDTILVASGKSGAYLTPDIKPWDIAAGTLFIEEQGGVVSDPFGNPLDLFKKVGGQFTLAAVFSKNAAIHEQMIWITKKYF